MSIILFLTFLTVLLENSAGAVTVHKVKVGETAILPCPSDDKIHRFQYWQLKNDEIIGPWNNNEKNKYMYEVWSGRLIIKSVSDSESGFYKCFSKHILASDIKSETVELLVMRDWEDAFENDSKVNTYRAIIGVLVILMLIMIGVFVFLMKRRRLFIFQESREGSPEELIPPNDSKGIYRATSISLNKPSTSRQKSSDQGLENAVVETDISTSFSIPNYA